jgi:hypothetical protein
MRWSLDRCSGCEDSGRTPVLTWRSRGNSRVVSALAFPPFPLSLSLSLSLSLCASRLRRPLRSVLTRMLHSSWLSCTLAPSQSRTSEPLRGQLRAGEEADGDSACEAKQRRQKVRTVVQSLCPMRVSPFSGAPLSRDLRSTRSPSLAHSLHRWAPRSRCHELRRDVTGPGRARLCSMQPNRSWWRTHRCRRRAPVQRVRALAPESWHLALLSAADSEPTPARTTQEGERATRSRPDHRMGAASDHPRPLGWSDMRACSLSFAPSPQPSELSTAAAATGKDRPQEPCTYRNTSRQRRAHGSPHLTSLVHEGNRRGGWTRQNRWSQRKNGGPWRDQKPFRTVCISTATLYVVNQNAPYASLPR